MRLWSRKQAPPARRPEEVLAEVDALAGAATEPDDQRRMLQLRHEGGVALLDHPAAEAPAWPEPDFGALPQGGVPETTPRSLTPALVRAAVLRSGCLLVRGLLPRADVARLVEDIDAAYAAREAAAEDPAALFEPFEPDPRFDLRFERGIIGAEGWSGLWAADAPSAAASMFEAFDRCGLRALAEGYLGERPAISVNKCLLRRVAPPAPATAAPSAWHQDGAFMGEVRALNAWVALTRCGDVAPGLDVVPRRLAKIAPAGTEGAVFDWSVSQAVAERCAGDSGIVRPIFGPGDVLLFDELFLHATAADPAMSDVRYAVECWFFGPSRFPASYAPLAA